MPQVVKKQYVSRNGEWVEVPGGGGGSSGSDTPVGAIIAYGGSTAPTGWHPCDGSAHGSAELQAVIGTTTTPDLRDRFIVGSGPVYPRMSTGGSAVHQHPLSGNGYAQIVGSSDSYTYSIRTGAVPNWTASHQIAGAGGAAASTKALTTSTILAGTTDNGSSLPPYYALIYIIKTV